MHEPINLKARIINQYYLCYAGKDFTINI